MSSNRVLVIHPKDNSTEFLRELYWKYDLDFLSDSASNSVIRRGLQDHSRIMLLGHGTEGGLLSPFCGDQFGRLIVGPRHVEFLRNKEIIGIWCNANIFAYRYGLTGLFSGMIISEESEYFDCTNAYLDLQEIRKHNKKWVRDLEKLLFLGTDLSEIPSKMKERSTGTLLDDFNYSSLYNIVNGEDVD